jgi:protocatechuate 3,4-dioxygenase beta subunit
MATRRQVLRGLGATAGAAPLVSLFGCADDPSSDGSGDGSSTNTTEGGPTSDDSTSATTIGSSEATSDASTSEATDTSGESDSGTPCVVEGWATGGTAAMCGGYPDPFAGGIRNPCELLCAAELGPCYAETLERKDISEGELGLPVRLAFLVVDETCTPVAGAEIDIWHTSPDGLYSGEDAAPNCTFNDPEAIAARWFRGVQSTDENGRADFDSCFPGWYSGRTIHIHITVRVAGTEYVTSQLVFEDTLVDGIIADQPIYSDRGPRDTTNVTDGIMSGADDLAMFTFETEHMTDGAMLAWKTLVIRSSADSPLCLI